jgi:hypothetical protein
MPLDDFYHKIVALQEFDIVKETTEIIQQNSFYLAALLRLQLQEGKDGQGKNVTVFGRDYYSDSTIQDKRYNGSGLGKQTEFITNYMHGAFYSGIKTRVSGIIFEMYSDVDYFNQIISRSGTVIMELNEKHLKEFSEEILFPELEKRFKSRVNGI